MNVMLKLSGKVYLTFDNQKEREILYILSSKKEDIITA